jgi:CRP-like cAMP-binding protein
MNSLTNRLALRLGRYGLLRTEDKLALDSEALSIRRFAPRDNLARKGEPVERIFMIVEGFACRYKPLAGGRRQITAFMLPGDLCDTRTFLLPSMDHSIAALSTVDAVVLTADAVRRLDSVAGLAQVLARSCLVHQSIAREWLVNVGYRTSFERLGHLLCELFERLQAVGLTHEHTCEIPLTQPDLADTLALSAVHVNRTLMELRRTGLVTFQSKHLIIHDYPTLRRAADFDLGYLYLATPVAESTVETAEGSEARVARVP